MPSLPKRIPGPRPRMSSHERRERQRRKQYEKERAELGGIAWQALMIGLVGCLFCAGKGFEEKVENAKVSTTNGGEDRDRDRGEREENDDRDEDGGRRHRHRHRDGRGRSRRSRSISDEGSDEEYGYGRGGGGRDDRIAYIPGDSERHRGSRSGNDERSRRYVDSREAYEVEEDPAPSRRRRVRREDAYD